VSVTTKVTGTIILVAALGVAVTVGPHLLDVDTDETRTVTLVGNWGLGRPNPGGAMIHSNLLPEGQKYIPVPNKRWPNGMYKESFQVPPGMIIHLIVAADEVVHAYCQIKGPGISTRPPASSPAGVVSNTVECTATVK
jgi:hypothetical protein